MATPDKRTFNNYIAVFAALLVLALFVGFNFFYVFSGSQEEQSASAVLPIDLSTQDDSRNERDVRVVIVEEGDGITAEPGDRVVVDYRGMFESGEVFDSSYDRGVPFQFVLGSQTVIPGWNSGIEGMQEGETRVVLVPPEEAYGAAGVTAPDGTVIIPPQATLIFEIELLSVEEEPRETRSTGTLEVI